MSRYYLIADDASIDPIEVYPSTGFEGIEICSDEPVRFQSSECDVKGRRITGIIVAHAGDISGLLLYAERLKRRQDSISMEGMIIEMAKKMEMEACEITQAMIEDRPLQLYPTKILTDSRRNEAVCRRSPVPAARGPPNMDRILRRKREVTKIVSLLF